MKACALRFAFAVVLLSATLIGHAQAAATSTDLDLLLDRKQYDRLEQALRAADAGLTAEDRAYFNGIMANRLYRADESIQLLEPMMPRLLISNLLRAEYGLCTLADDYAKTYRYGDAANTYAQAATLAQSRGMQSLCNAEREARRWALLRGLPAQAVETSGPFSLNGLRDTLGLIEVPVKTEGYSGTWIVDTGANLSVISRSVADQMGLSVLSGSESTEGASGILMPVRIALVPELHLGSAVIRNVPVLVVDDANLNFPTLNFSVKGCIGLPVLAALKNLTISQNGQVTFGGATAPSAVSHNLFMEGLTPAILADFGRGDQLFTVDTGAMGTILSVAFYEQTSINPETMKLTSLQLSGAGGSLFTPAYQLQDVPVRVAGVCGDVPSALLLTQKSTSAEEFYGNIGQNLLRLFGSYTFDFRQMQFRGNGAANASCPVPGGSMVSAAN